MFRFAAGLLICALLPSVALAEQRVALVIGNSAYRHTPTLTNPRNDAADMAIALEALGFQVIEGFDLDKPSFDRKVRDFADALSGAKEGVFFYAGHGLQVAGQNYLVPVDAKLSTAAALDWEMVRLDLVQRTMERETETNVIFLDACRDNPLARNLARAMGTRSAEIGHGLAATEAGVGTLISFSTQPGNVALDGTGRNSPFAGALLRRIGASSDDLSALLIDVRNDVRKATQNKQVPWEHSALTGRFYFNQSLQAGPPTSTTPAALSEAAQAWDRTKDTTDIGTLEAFITRYKGTFYAQLAKAHIEKLKEQRMAHAAPPPAPPTSAFDGTWRVHRTSENCLSTSEWFAVHISQGQVTSTYGIGRTVKGIVDASGKVQFDHTLAGRDGRPDGILWTYTGVLAGNSGSGSFFKAAACSGKFTATREVASDLSSSKRGFDGEWVVTGVGGSGCVIKNWKQALRIENNVLHAAGNSAPAGKVRAGGEFEYVYRNVSNPSASAGTYRGKLTGDSGTGEYNYANVCIGTLTLERR